MYDSFDAAPSTILLAPKYGRDVNAGGTSVSARPWTIIAGLPFRFAVRFVSFIPACTRVALASVPVARLRRQIAPSMLKSPSRVDGDTEIESRIEPFTGSLSLTMLMPELGGTPLNGPKIRASVVAAVGAVKPAVSVVA